MNCYLELVPSIQARGFTPHSVIVFYLVTVMYIQIFYSSKEFVLISFLNVLVYQMVQIILLVYI